MTAHPAVVALGKNLQALLSEHGTSGREASRALGWHSAFLARSFNGHRPLRVEVVFQVLAHVGVLPYEFFRLHYPFGGSRAGLYVAGAGSSFDIPGLVTLEDAIREQVRREGVLSPSEYRLRMGAWLRREIHAQGDSMRSVSLNLGLGPTALGQALRGESQLTFFHVFGALEAIGSDPGRMFLAVFLPEPATPIERLEQAQRLSILEKVVVQSEEGFLARQKRLKKRTPRKSKPPAEDEPGDGPPT